MTLVGRPTQLLAVLALLASACGTGEDGDAAADAGVVRDAGVADSGVARDGGPPPRCTMSHDVACRAESIDDLGLFDSPSGGRIAEEGLGGDFLSHVDARAGGSQPNSAYVYARFTDVGLEKVEITDYEAFDSTAWDVAFRRFVIRVNSGVAGPSCVAAARTAPSVDYDTLTSAPDGLQYREEQYYSVDTCDLVTDGTPIGAPATALASFWRFDMCVQMTGNVYVIALADGRYVKFQVVGYYAPDRQIECDETGSVGQPSGSGNVRVRWAWIDPPAS